MGVSQFHLDMTEKRQALFKGLEKIPEYGKKSKSELVEIALEEFLAKHMKSNNPQTVIEHFDRIERTAIPNLFEAYDRPDMWIKYFTNMSKDSHKEFLKAYKKLETIYDSAKQTKLIKEY